MMDQESEDDALLARLANSLEVVRQNAAVARSATTDHMAATMDRIETELQKLSAGIDTLRRDGEQQRTTVAQLELVATKSEAASRGLCEIVETL